MNGKGVMGAHLRWPGGGERWPGTGPVPGSVGIVTTADGGSSCFLMDLPVIPGSTGEEYDGGSTSLERTRNSQ
jgi:hypothetical protein